VAAAGLVVHPRVVVERLDSLGPDTGLDSGLGGAHVPPPAPALLPLSAPALPLGTPLPLSLALAAPSLEEETYASAAAPLGGQAFSPEVTFELCDSYEASSMEEDSGKLLDSFLAEAGILETNDSTSEEKWVQGLDELFPDLD